MKAYTMGARALTENGNQIKEEFLKKMVISGEITQEKADKMNNYCVVIAEKGFFGKIWDKIFGNDEDMHIIIVRIIN